MKRNNISKIALLTGLLLINTNVKGFYQCVLKKEIVLEQEKYELAKQNIDNQDVWKIVYNNHTSGILDKGIYKVSIAGGQGGKGSDVDGFARKWGGYGGLGEKKEQVFIIKSTVPFEAIIGKKGTDAYEVYDYAEGIKGTKGGTSIFNIPKIIYLTANGGEGGYYGRLTENLYSSYNGWSGRGFDANGNKDDGYVKIYKYIG